MTVEEVYDLITANKNHKKYNLEKDSDKFTLTLGNFRLLVNKQIKVRNKYDCIFS